jgi:hypothetical protein
MQGTRAEFSAKNCMDFCTRQIYLALKPQPFNAGGSSMLASVGISANRQLR